jgi:cell division protein FtsQ
MTAPPSTRSTGGRRWRLVRAHPDAVPYSVRRFMQRGRYRRMRKSKSAAMRWATAAVVVLLAALAGWVTYGTSFLGVRDIRVTGVDILSGSEVSQAARVKLGTPLARVDLSAVRQRVAGLVPVDRVTVHRDWPHTIVVDVTERTAVAVVPQGKKFVLVDRSGVAFHTIASRPPGNPVVAVKALPDAKAAVQVLAALTPELKHELASVTVDGPARIRLKLTGGREVVWGDSADSGQKAKVATALLARGDGKVYDVSAPDVVTIR